MTTMTTTRMARIAQSMSGRPSRVPALADDFEIEIDFWTD